MKDMLRASIKIERDGNLHTPGSEAFEHLEHIEALRLARFLQKVGLLPKEAFSAAHKLVELRNKYAHARGGNPDQDALDAIGHLHQVVKGTVSVYEQVIADTIARHSQDSQGEP